MVATDGDPVMAAPACTFHLMRSVATLAGVICVSAGLKKRRRGPPAYIGHSVAVAAPAEKVVAIVTTRSAE